MRPSLPQKVLRICCNRAVSRNIAFVLGLVRHFIKRFVWILVWVSEDWSNSDPTHSVVSVLLQCYA